jgi:hypothetical protein
LAGILQDASLVCFGCGFGVDFSRPQARLPVLNIFLLCHSALLTFRHR